MLLRSALAAYGLTVTQCIDVVTKRHDTFSHFGDCSQVKVGTLPETTSNPQVTLK
jgi:hypothetical protein